MKGQILDYSVQSNSGVISGEDGQHYQFVGQNWQATNPPRRGLHVDFTANGDQAVDIYEGFTPQPVSQTGNFLSAPRPGGKSRIGAALFAIFLGGLGVHKFYLGETTSGIILLIAGTFGWLLIIPGIAAWVWGFIEGIIYLTKSDQEFERQYG